jgi:nucleoside-diphosphate-sugar epimerase
VSSSQAVSSTGANTILFGGSGFFGTHILQNHPQMISVGRTAPTTANRHIQIESLADLRALRDVRFDKVIYLIGHSDNHGMEKETLAPGEPSAFDYHLFPTIQVLEQLKEYPITKLIHFSTILLYDPTRITLPVTETAPIDPYRTRYVLSKHMSEEACGFYSAWIPIINVRISNTYGPTRLKRYDLINDLIRQVLETGRGSVWSTKPWRDFIHVEDVADAVGKLLASDYTGTVNLGTGKMTQVQSVVDFLRELSGCEIEDQDRQVGGPMRFQCDMTTVNRIIDWKPRYSISEGIEQTYSLMKAWAAS